MKGVVLLPSKDYVNTKAYYQHYTVSVDLSPSSLNISKAVAIFKDALVLSIPGG